MAIPLARLIVAYDGRGVQTVGVGARVEGLHLPALPPLYVCLPLFREHGSGTSSNI
jgi:hypothetical protein